MLLPLRPITVSVKFSTVTKTRWPIVGDAGNVIVCPAVFTYTCVLTVAVTLLPVTIDVMPTDTGSDAIFAAVTASSKILAVDTVLSLGVPMLLTEIAALITSMVVVLGGAVENVRTAGSAALTV